MGTNDRQAGGNTSNPATTIWTLLVWKLKTAAISFLHIIVLQGCYQAWNRRVRTWYVNTFFSVMYGSAPVGQDLMEVGLSRLTYLPQTVSKEQSCRKGKKRGFGEEPQVKKPQDCCLCQTHIAGVTQSTQPEPSPWQWEHSSFIFPFAAFISLFSGLFSEWNV